mgnify:CR=1 FL=1
MASKSKFYYTLLGFLTIIIWGTSAIFTRNLSTGLGAYTSAALVNLIGGIVVLVTQLIKKEGLTGIREVPRSLFVIYTASSYVSMSMVQSDESVIVLVLIRFLWPLFTLIFTIPNLHARASLWLICSVALSFVGIVVAKLGADIFHLSSFADNILSGGDLAGYAMGFVVAISWGVYTNLVKKYVGTKKVDGVGIYMIVTAAILGIISIFMDEPRNFSVSLIGQILYAGIVVGALANTLWNLSIKKGNMLLVVLVSNFLPIISTVMTSFMLGVGITVPIIIGSLLVVIGTLWSKSCFKEF